MSQRVARDQTTENAWKEAQQWEEAHWVRTQKLRARFGKNYIWRVLRKLGLVEYYRGNDYNDWWADQFNRYDFLPARLDNAIEVGCGPYTNIRLAIDQHPASHLVLSDPLIRTYVKFKLTFVAAMYAEAACTLDDHPLEELPYRDDYFDLTVMINVLDHVRDARECMKNVLRVTKPGGFLILGQDLTNEEDLEVLKSDPGAVGHPIKLDSEWFDSYLGTGFDSIIHKVLSREEGRAPQHHYGTLIFAGRKRA